MVSRTEAPTPAERWAPYVAAALFAIPVLVAKYPPMDDLPLHEASVGLWRHWGDVHFAPRGLYFLNLGHSNQLFSLLVFLLSFLVPIGWASKVVVACCLFALPLAAAHLANHLGSSRWTALLVAPLGLGWLFFWGLIQNILGLAVLLALLPAIDRFCARPAKKSAAWMCAALVLLHFAHQAMQLVALVAFFFFSVVARSAREPRARQTWLRGVPIAFGVAVVFAANRYSRYLSGPRQLRGALAVFPDLLSKVVGVPGILFGGFEPYIGNLMLALAAAPVSLLLAQRFRASPTGSRPFFRRVHEWRFELLALGLLLAYFVAPANFQSTTLVYERFLPPAWALFVVCAGIGTRNTLRSFGRVLCGIVPLASVLVSWPVFADSHRVYSELEPLIDRIDVGSSVMTLNLDREEDENRLWSPTDAMGHIVAVRGGRALFDYTLSPISPVSQRPDKQWSDPIDRIDENPLGLRPDWDFTRFRYVLFNTRRAGLGAAVALALKDEASLTAQSGAWYLFESRLPLVPFDAYDATLPEPRPPTLRRKLSELAAQLGPKDPANGAPQGHE
jgi:hypothetical protein